MISQEPMTSLNPVMRIGAQIVAKRLLASNGTTAKSLAALSERGNEVHFCKISVAMFYTLRKCPLRRNAIETNLQNGQKSSPV